MTWDAARHLSSYVLHRPPLMKPQVPCVTAWSTYIPLFWSCMRQKGPSCSVAASQTLSQTQASPEIPSPLSGTGGEDSGGKIGRCRKITQVDEETWGHLAIINWCWHNNMNSYQHQSAPADCFLSTEHKPSWEVVELRVNSVHSISYGYPCSVSCTAVRAGVVQHCMGSSTRVTTHTGAWIMLRSKLELRLTPPTTAFSHHYQIWAYSTALLSHTETPLQHNTLQLSENEHSRVYLIWTWRWTCSLDWWWDCCLWWEQVSAPHINSRDITRTHTGPPTSVGRNS